MVSRLTDSFCCSLKTGCNVFAALGFLCGLAGLTVGIELADQTFIVFGIWWIIDFASLVTFVS